MRRKMKGRGKAILPIIILLVLCKPTISLAGDITFSSSGTIGPNDVYDWVYLENDGTVVDMTGGLISDLFTISPYYTTFNMTGGTISNSASLNGASVFTINGGTINCDIYFESGTSGYFYDGTVLTNALKIYDESAVNIYGGDIQFDIATVSGTLNIYGSDFEYTLFSEIPQIYMLTGELLDSSAFSIKVYGQDLSNINLVPEPTTLLLLGLGGLLLRKRF